MSYSKLISVVIPLYNSKEYIITCIRSVIEQTYSNLEVLIVDDGSTDGSFEYCEQYLRSDDLLNELRLLKRNNLKRNVQLIHQNNQGQVAARLSGANLVIGEYVIFVDSDDYIDTDYISLLANEISDGCDMVTSALQYDGEKKWLLKEKVETGLYIGNEIREKLLPNFIYDFEKSCALMIHSMSNKLFKREMIVAVMRTVDCRLPIGEDGLIVFGALLKSRNVIVTNLPGYHYVQHNTSTIHSKGLENLPQIQELGKAYINMYSKLNQDAIGVNNDLLQMNSFATSIEMQVLELMGKFGISALANELNCDYETHFIIPKKIIGKSVVIYGMGEKGRLLLNELKESNLVTVCGCVDKNFISMVGVTNPQLVSKLHFDYILIAIEDAEVVHSVVEFLLNLGIEYKRIIPLEKQNRFVRRIRK